MGICAWPGCEEWVNPATTVYCCELHKQYHRVELAERERDEYAERRDIYRDCANRVTAALEECQNERDELRAEVARLTAVREPVRWFAEQMERKLKANDHKSHWRESDVVWLFERMQDERIELWEAFKPTRPFGCFVDTPNDVERVIDEAADVANFAMMIADKARAALAGEEVPE